MKRCPSCARNYRDDSLTYCLEDGATLLSDGSNAPLAATLIIPEPRATMPARPETSYPNPGIQQPQSHGYSVQPPAWMVAPGPPALMGVASPRGRGLEVTSLIFAITSFVMLGFCILSGATGVNPTVIGGIFIFSVLLALAGALLGIVSMVKVARDINPQNSKTLGIVGLVLNSVYLIIVVIFLVVGAIASSG